MLSRLVFCLQNEARKLNHKEVVEEDRRAKLPTNWEARQKRAEYEIETLQKRKVSILYVVLFKLWI